MVGYSCYGTFRNYLWAIFDIFRLLQAPGNEFNTFIVLTVAAGDEADVIIDGSLRIPAQAWQPIPGTSNPGYVSTNVVLREGE